MWPGDGEDVRKGQGGWIEREREREREKLALVTMLFTWLVHFINIQILDWIELNLPVFQLDALVSSTLNRASIGKVSSY